MITCIALAFHAHASLATVPIAGDAAPSKLLFMQGSSQTLGNSNFWFVVTKKTFVGTNMLK